MIKTEQLKGIYYSIRTFFRRRAVKIVVSLFAILFAIAVLGYLVYREKDVLLNYHWQVHPAALAASFALYLVALLLVVWVWGLIMRSLGSKVDFWQHFRSFSIANVAKRLPGTLWYVALRGEMYQQNGMSIKITTLASGVEMAVSVFGGIFASILFAISIMAKYPAGIAALAVLFILCLIFLNRRTLGKILKLLGSDIHFFNYRSIMAWIGIYFLVWIIGGVILFSVTNVLYPVGLDHLGYIIGCWSLVGVLSFLLLFMPTNMGFNEIGISLLLSAIMPSSIAVIVALSSRVILLFYEIILAAICWALELKKERG